jgi:hypothetical protein
MRDFKFIKKPIMSKDSSDFIKQLTDSSRIAAAYAFTTTISSPFMTLAALSGSRMVNENKSFFETLTNPTNIRHSFHPKAWVPVAIRRTFVTPALGEGTKKAADHLKELDPAQRLVLYGILSLAMSAVETSLTIVPEVRQILFSRDGAYPEASQLKKSTSASIKPMLMRNAFPPLALFTAKEIVDGMEKENGEFVDPKIVSVIGAFCGMISGAISMPATVATNLAIKTGETPTMSNVLNKGLKALPARATQQSISIFSIIMASQLIDLDATISEKDECGIPSSIPKAALNTKKFDVKRLLSRIAGRGPFE